MKMTINRLIINKNNMRGQYFKKLLGFIVIYSYLRKVFNSNNDMKKIRNLIVITISALLVACATKPQYNYVKVTGGGHICYEEKGKGTPLILLHGHSLDMRMWDGQFDEFAKHYRTIRLDFRGYGKSSEQIEGFQFTHVDDLITLMDSLRIARANIVGLSMGGFIAGDLLAMHPERIKKCVLASGSIRRGSKGPSEPMDSKEHSKRDAEIKALSEKGVDVMKSEWIDALVNGGGSKRESIRKPLGKMIGEWTAWQPQNKEARLYYAKDAWEQLTTKRPKTPVLMLHGETENKKGMPKEAIYLPNFTRYTLPDCGHMMNMEQPEAFNSVVLKFLGR